MYKYEEYMIATNAPFPPAEGDEAPPADDRRLSLIAGTKSDLAKTPKIVSQHIVNSTG